MIMTIVVSVISLGLLIFFHELGHFLMAKKIGIRVEKFSLGFGRELIGFTRGETRYLISVIPFGGYVKMAGENSAERGKGDSWEFNMRSVWETMLVVFFGPFFNFVLAFLLFVIVFIAGVSSFNSDTTIIGKVSDGYPAQAAGLLSGDKIISINGEKVSNWVEVQGGIRKGIDSNRALDIKILREMQEKELNVLPKWDKTEGRKILGVSPQETVKKFSVLEAIKEGFMQTVTLSYAIMKGLFMVIFGKVKADIAGPIGIVQMLGAQARYGITSLLYFVGFLSVNLAIINLFPIPIVDGGVILLLFIEKFKGRPVSDKSRQVLEQIGLALLIILMVFATFKDIMRIR
jgi:regulator of sigma E protease